MRAGIGLVGILIAVGALVYFLGSKGGGLDHEKSIIDAGHKAQEQASQIAGRDAQGNPVKQSATLELQTTGGSSSGILVTSIVADGPYAKFWGLQRNDIITDIGPLPVKEVVTDAGAADDYVMDAYQKQSQLTVMRDGQKITLPAAATANAPTPAKTGSGNPLQDQLNAIQSQQVPTH